MPDTYEGPSLDTSGAEPSGPLEVIFPFHERYDDPTHAVYSQRYFQAWDSYSPLALNSSGPSSTHHVGDDALNDAGAGLASFVRRWANVPATNYDYELTSVTYPGIYLARDPATVTVMVQKKNEYFLVGTGGSYASADLIPLIPEQRVIDTNGLDFSIFSGNVYLNNGGGTLYATLPSAATYLGLMVEATTPGVFNLVMDSTLNRYLGNIWCRTTRYVPAK